MKTLWIFTLLLTLSCTKTTTEKQLQHLSGYWEIEKVVFPDGTTKQYTISQSIDYFQLDPDSTGFRKKLQPRLNGRFSATDHTEGFEVRATENQLKIQYKSNLNEWQETIINIDENQLIIKNKNNLTYFYKRFSPITF